VSDVVDLVFALQGGPVALDYADRLYRSLAACLPWLEGETAAGVHPLAGVSPGDHEIYLTRRARLALRLPASRLDQARALTGSRLDLGGPVDVGAASERPLSEITTLYSAFVSVGTADEAAFMVRCEELLAAERIAGRLVCGKAHRGCGSDAQWHGFSLMVFGLSIEDSLRLQRQGIGGERKHGCGIFIPHKSVHAVGE
jgi:CRISPR-associated protein Cas6